MYRFPAADPGVANARTPARFLWWLAGRQWLSLAYSAIPATLYTLSQAVLPAIVGASVDAITRQDQTQLMVLAAAVLVLGMLVAGFGVLQHRAEMANWFHAGYRTAQLVTRHSGHLGATLSRRFPSGEVLAVGTADIDAIGDIYYYAPRAFGAVAGIVAIAVLLVTISPTMGLVILVGVPLALLLLGPLLRPLHRRESHHRDVQATLTTRAGDLVLGLRVLRGIGGQRLFADRYREGSQRLRAAGVRAGRVEAAIEAMHVLLAGVLAAVVIVVGAQLALQGVLTAGQLVTCYAYTMLLLLPVEDLLRFVDRVIPAHVAARRVVRILATEPERAPGDLADDPSDAGPMPELYDPHSGLRASAGGLTGIVADEPGVASALADWLGDLHGTGSDVRLGGTRLGELATRTLREQILVADTDAILFSGTLRDELAGTSTASDEQIHTALHTAGATDIVASLPRGLDSWVAERGQEFSGGQNQRLRLARALLAEAEVLILVEPTSAVDTPTEVSIAQRLATERSGRTTVLLTTSPTLLEQAKTVAFVAGTQVVATGSHRQLLCTEPRYRDRVARDLDNDTTEGGTTDG